MAASGATTPAVGDEFGHRSAAVGDDRRAAGHGLDDAEAERLVEVNEVEQGVGATEDGRSVGGVHGPVVAPVRRRGPTSTSSSGVGAQLDLTAQVEVPTGRDEEVTENVTPIGLGQGHLQRIRCAG